MAVSGIMALSRATLWAGSGAIVAQRGSDTWGANYVYNPLGIQGDVLLIADEFKNLSTSGTFATDAEVKQVSGVLSSGYTDAILAASGAAVVTASGAARSGIEAAVTLTSPVVVTSIVPSVSGAFVIGTTNKPVSSGFMVAVGADGVLYNLKVLTGGIISGVPA